MFAASSHVASLASLLTQHHHPINIYLLGTEDKAKSVPQRTSREGWQKQTVTQHRYKTKGCILSSIDHTSWRVWTLARNLWVEREKKIQMGMILELSLINDEHLLISVNLFCVLS